MTDRELLDWLCWLTTEGRPAWHERAACRGLGPRPWFPESGDDTTYGRETCARCPVAAECAEAGRDEPAGLWGGTTPRQRAAGRRAAA